jgi:hypothetical protein
VPAAAGARPGIGDQRPVGGGPIDEVISGAVGGNLVAVYAPDLGGPRNTRAGTIAARLGYEARDVQRRLAGPILIVGQDPSGVRDIDVPPAGVPLNGLSGQVSRARASVAYCLSIVMPSPRSSPRRAP